ncbi:MAG: hypothetical protein ACOX9R_00620 [Armatimonadota bacterium]|jgi:hypothetical protein
MKVSAIPTMTRHLRTLAERGIAAGYGPDDSRQWMASLDTRTGRYPEDDRRPPGIEPRCYRWIEAPRGCNAYWDGPQLAAAHALAQIAGAPSLHDAADACVADFLDRCVANTGLLLWGNHYYWDAFEGAVMRFTGSRPPAPCDPATDPGDLHEVRPLPAAWEALWRVAPARTETAIRAMLDRHLFEPETGGFNRHADLRAGCAFLEAGGLLIDAAGWLHQRRPDRALVETAARIARWSFSHRGAATGLLENNPTETRWDKHMATTEVGMWAGCLLRAGARMPPLQSEFAQMAADATDAWLRLGWDEAAGMYFGRLAVADGTPVLGPKTTEYQPGEYADPWEPLFPAHDYPMQMAEACVELLRRTGRPIFEQAVERWVGHLRRSLPARGGHGGYAEHYGRAIHLLCVADEALGRAEWRDLAAALAEEAVQVLWTGELFRGHPGEDRYDAVDGVGILMLALLRLETGEEPPMMGFAF